MKTLHNFVQDLEHALKEVRGAEEATCHTCEILRIYSQDGIELPEEIRAGSTECYARHLIHKHEGDGFCVVCMVWGPGQGTPVHDHGGIWCVEGCVEGQLQITSYRMNPQGEDSYSLQQEGSISVSQGCVGCLIPPFEHHKIENVSSRKAITLHVYGQELTNCRRYLPKGDGFYRTETSCLRYNSVHEGRF